MVMVALNQSAQALTASMDMPHTQNTAPVLEFRCMYTSDLRRKQKRWQDGRLKFHTFNKRVMVYDERSNFVGDTHWRKDYEFDDGEELELERGGILVEVGECIGKRDQDLAELVDKRVKEREERAAAKNAASPMQTQASLNRPQTLTGSALLRPKSLNAVLGNPTSHYGKAVIPNLSPFEQRRQANPDGSENDRPAKRRKQDDTPPSENGYSQSLLGTKLTLASLGPPSTTTVRYEPLRPSIQRTPAATIDLTEDGDDHRRLDKPATTWGERVAAKTQRQRPHKSPPARSGYASSLTGASLALNKPESFAAKRPFRGLGLSLSTKGISQADETGSSSLVELDSLMEDELEQERPAKKMQKQNQPAKKRTKPLVSDPQIPSRSPSSTVSKSSTTLKDKAAQHSPASLLMADQPLSTLRIKSRAPRKMMMLMERPMSRSPAQTESSDDTQTALKRQHNPKLAPQIIATSQATVRLDAFHEQQERRLQERLNDKQPDDHVDELSSSLADSGIGHQMIDSLLSRRTKLQESIPPAIPADAPRRRLSMNPEREHEGEQIAQARKLSCPVKAIYIDPTSDAVFPKASKEANLESHSPDHAELDAQELHQLQPPRIQKILLQSTMPSTNFTRSMVASMSDAQKLRQLQPPSSPKVIPRSTIPCTGSPSGMRASPSDLRLSDEPAVGVNEIEEALETNWQENMASIQGMGSSQNARASSKQGNPDKTSKSTSPLAHSPAANVATSDKSSALVNSSNIAINGNAGMEPVVTEIERTITRGSPIAHSKIAPLPAHFSSAIMSATDHFRAIIKCSVSPSNQTASQPPPNLEQPALPLALVPQAQKLDPMSSEVVIKTSPKPSPPMAETLGSEDQPTETMASAASVDNTSDLTIPTMPNARKGQPKAKLANPATRGLSVQMTANRTVNALVPACGGLPSMPPPLPLRTSIQPSRTLAQDKFLASRMKEPVKKVTPGGPWSRESFDLFGSWGPPGRNTGTSTVNG